VTEQVADVHEFDRLRGYCRGYGGVRVAERTHGDAADAVQIAVARIVNQFAAFTRNERHGSTAIIF
jgi:hypothetical protein